MMQEEGSYQEAGGKLKERMDEGEASNPNEADALISCSSIWDPQPGTSNSTAIPFVYTPVMIIC